MRHPYRLPALVAIAAVLVMAASWLWDVRWVGRGADAPSTAKPSTAAPSAPASPSASDPRLVSALLQEGDLGGAWRPTGGAATWRDGLLKGRAEPPECQELLDAVYAENLLGEPSGATAVAGFDDSEYGAQVRYQVGTYRQQEVEARLALMGQLAEGCQEFTSTGPSGQTYDVRVAPFELTGIGDAAQGLRMTVHGDADGGRGELTLDVAALCVGDRAALLTHGGLRGIDTETTRHAAELAAQRLKDSSPDQPDHSTAPPEPTAEPGQRESQGSHEDPAYEAGQGDGTGTEDGGPGAGDGNGTEDAGAGAGDGGSGGSGDGPE